MNTANLQLEGLLLALTAIVGLMRSKGIAGEDEISAALAEAERAALGDGGRPEVLSSANVEAVLFPIRYLAAAAKATDGPLPAFSKIATQVGQAKRVPRAPL
jgi:hypothetical protein